MDNLSEVKIGSEGDRLTAGLTASFEVESGEACNFALSAERGLVCTTNSVHSIGLRALAGVGQVGKTLTFTHYSVRSAGCCSAGKRRRRTLVLAAPKAGGGDALAARWCTAVRWLLCGREAPEGMLSGCGVNDGPLAMPPKRKLLVLINPRSGPGKALQMWEGPCAPIFEAAWVETDVVVTTRANHALEYVRDMEGSLADRYDGVVIVSGDGLMYEVLQGTCEGAPQPRILPPSP